MLHVTTTVNFFGEKQQFALNILAIKEEQLQLRLLKKTSLKYATPLPYTAAIHLGIGHAGAGTPSSGPCGKFGDKLFTATVVRARRKNAGIAEPTSNFFNAAMATVAKKSVIELSARPTRIY